MLSKNKLYLFLILNIVTLFVKGQVTINNQKTIGGKGGDNFHTMWVTTDGGLIVGGSSNSNVSGQKTENSRGSSDYWIVKLDNKRHIQWDKTIGGSFEDALFSIKQTIDGGYILGGFSVSNKSGEKSENSRGNADYWVIKLDSLGNIEWDKTLGGNDDDELYSVDQTTDSGYILGGYSYSNISGEKSQNGRGVGDFWIVKLNVEGQVQWDKTFGGENEDEINSLQQTIDGGYILGGFSSSDISGEKSQNSRGGVDYWVIKLDGLGNIEWDKTLGGNNVDILNAISQTKDRGYILGGMSRSNISGEKTQIGNGGADYWIIKLDSLGNIQWDKSIGGSFDDVLFSLQTTLDSGYIVNGSSNSNSSGNKTENSRGGTDYWIVKLNKSGNIQWDKTFGGNLEDGGLGVKENKKNKYIVGGYSFSGISGDKSQKSKGSLDYWIIYANYSGNLKSKSINSISSNKKKVQISSNFNIYPNPTNDILFIHSLQKRIFTLINQEGKILITVEVEGTKKIDISSFTSGLYYLYDINSGKSEKIIINRKPK